jgi:hypothetical protein
LVVVESEDGEIEVKPQIKVLVSDAFERRDALCEVPGKRLPTGWLARQKIIDQDRKVLRQILDEPGDLYCCSGLGMTEW